MLNFCLCEHVRACRCAATGSNEKSRTTYLPLGRQAWQFSNRKDFRKWKCDLRLLGLHTQEPRLPASSTEDTGSPRRALWPCKPQLEGSGSSIQGPGSRSGTGSRKKCKQKQFENTICMTSLQCIAIGCTVPSGHANLNLRARVPRSKVRDPGLALAPAKNVNNNNLKT